MANKKTRKKEMQKEIERLEGQLVTQKEANGLLSGENCKLKKIYSVMEKHFDSQMKIAEKEIKRLNVIVDYLETRV